MKSLCRRENLSPNFARNEEYNLRVFALVAQDTFFLHDDKLVDKWVQISVERKFEKIAKEICKIDHPEKCTCLWYSEPESCMSKNRIKNV